MPQVNDEIVKAIRIDNVVAGLAINDLERLHLGANGITLQQINDMYTDLGAVGSYNDGLYGYLGGLGHIGALTDRWYSFWVGGGAIGEAALDLGIVASCLVAESWDALAVGNTLLRVEFGITFERTHDQLVAHEQGNLPNPLWNDVLVCLDAQGF